MTCSSFLKTIGNGSLVLLWALWCSPLCQAQSVGHSQPVPQSSESSDILPPDQLEAKTLDLLKRISPELQPELIAVLKDSSARQKAGSQELAKQKEAWNKQSQELTQQKQLWTQEHQLSTQLSAQLKTEREAEARQVRNVAIGGYVNDDRVTVEFGAVASWNLFNSILVSGGAGLSLGDQVRPSVGIAVQRWLF